MANLDFFKLYRDIIAIPSISSTDPAWDQSNQGVIQLLADWFSQLGFSIEISPIADLPGKFNLIATLGSGEGGLLLSGHRIRCRSMLGVGARIPSPSLRRGIVCMDSAPST